jgi:peptidoglycan hydrolase-like protein with peptidoglycan-binding domain
LIISLLCFLSLILSGCDIIYRILQKEGAEEKDLLGEIVPCEHNPKVEEVQKLLKLYGYNVGKVDGILGINTRNAIQAFQEDNDLKVSRFVDKETWERLNVFGRCGLVVDGVVNITGVQRALKEAGLDPGPTDGKLGRRTQSAIKAFQMEQGLQCDGKIGFRTLRALAKYLLVKED